MRSIDELAAEICTLSGHINAANLRLLELVAEFDQRNGWSDGATQSCAHWLNWKCGIAMGAAREKVRVARALGKLPKISAAMKSGALSYSKVREITRVATPQTEDYLLMIAEYGTAAHVENWCVRTGAARKPRSCHARLGSRNRARSLIDTTMTARSFFTADCPRKLACGC